MDLALHRPTCLRLLAALATLYLLAACGSSPPSRSTSGAVPAEIASSAASVAVGQLGRPYRYGGSSPTGFDCSGLVHFSYARAGFTAPRSTATLRQASHPVSRGSLRPGDLVFFDQDGKKSSHVGIWIGDGRFVHAPSSGGRVRTDSLDSDYWQEHFVGARRL